MDGWLERPNAVHEDIRGLLSQRNQYPGPNTFEIYACQVVMLQQVGLHKLPRLQLSGQNNRWFRLNQVELKSRDRTRSTDKTSRLHAYHSLNFLEAITVAAASTLHGNLPGVIEANYRRRVEDRPSHTMLALAD